jgi:hypothetical protein
VIWRKPSLRAITIDSTSAASGSAIRSAATCATTSSTLATAASSASTAELVVQNSRRRNGTHVLRTEGQVVANDILHRIAVVDDGVAASASTTTATVRVSTTNSQIVVTAATASVHGSAERASERGRSVGRAPLLLGRSVTVVDGQRGLSGRLTLRCSSLALGDALSVSQVQDAGHRDSASSERTAAVSKTGTRHEGVVKHNVQHGHSGCLGNADDSTSGSDRNAARVLNVNNTVTESEALTTETLLGIARLEKSVTRDAAHGLILDLISRERQVVLCSTLEGHDSVRIHLFSVKRDTLKGLGLDALKPSTDLLHLLLGDLSRIEVGVVEDVTRRVSLNACDKLGELGHVSGDQVNGLLTVFPTTL